MAYDNQGARVGAAGHFASRITSALITAGGIQADSKAASETFAEIAADVLDVLNTLEGGQSASKPSAENVIKANFPGTTEVADDSALKILSDSGAPHPAWLFTQAAEAGVTAVYDNRADLAENPKRPWYKQAEPEVDSRKAKGFWPPRK